MEDLNLQETPRDQAIKLGGQIRSRRRELGLTQQELADLSGVGVRTIHETEHGKTTVRFEILAAVLGTLGLKLEAVIAQEGSADGS